MSFNRILVTYKRSNYEKYVLEDHLKKLKKHRTLSQPLLDSHKGHYESLEGVETILKSLGVKYTMMVRSKYFKESDYDLVITVGGDGTFLDASQFLINTPIVGVNSNPVESVGHFCSQRLFTLKQFLLQKKHHVFKAHRLQVDIDGKSQRPVLNDILITNIHPASTSRYVLQVGKKREEQKSSGIWISTSLGSTAAIQGAGGKRMNKKSPNYQIKVREPYVRGRKAYKLDKKILTGKTVTKIFSGMRDGMVYHDGTKRVQNFIFGSEVVISCTAPKLKILGYK